MITWINIRQGKGDNRGCRNKKLFLHSLMPYSNVCTYVRESRTQFACCSITIHYPSSTRQSSTTCFWLEVYPRACSRRFCGQIYNANGRTADMQQRTKWTLTFSSTWRFRVDTCKSLASTYIYCVFVNQVCTTMKIFLLFSSSTTVNNSYYYTGFPTCCE